MSNLKEQYAKLDSAYQACVEELNKRGFRISELERIVAGLERVVAELRRAELRRTHGADCACYKCEALREVTQ